MTSYQVQQFLISTKAKYIESSKPDILSVIQQFKDIVPDTENYLFPDGKRRLAFLLKGTIPILYKGACYNIPIAVYLWDTHPYYAPVCFVRPTKTMVVKESESVNKEGRVFLPYLNEWRYPGYDLVTLLQIMTMMFQEKCPVFARSSASQAKATIASTPTTTSTPVSSAVTNPTPYPTSYPSTGMPTPYPAASAFSNPAPYPMGQTQPNHAYVNTPQPNNSYGMPRAVRPSPPIPTTGTIQPEHIRASLLSALEDKFKHKIQEDLGMNYAEMASINQTKKELQTGQLKLKQMIEELESAQREVDSFTKAYELKKVELTKAVRENGDCDSSIDSAIDATTPLHKQLLDNYASDLACDDTIYALGQAKIKGVLSLQDYLRHVRSVSRKQFEHRATMQKCRRVAGLPL